MPLYDFVCDKCGFCKEELIKLNDKEPVCDKCGSSMRKAMSAPAFHLKGSGWAADNYGLAGTKKVKKEARKDG